MNDQFEISKASGAHQQLSRLEGKWEGVARTWFDPTKLEDESPVTGTIKLILDGRFALHEYTGSFKGDPLSGMAILGYHLDLGKFQCAWVDSFHSGTAIMFSEGNRGGKEFSVLGGYTYVTPEFEQQWGWRTDIEQPADDELVITSYNISPDGQESKATEVSYRRVK